MLGRKKVHLGLYFSLFDQYDIIINKINFLFQYEKIIFSICQTFFYKG